MTRPVRSSRAAVTVAGFKVIPQWDWSPDFLRLQRQRWRALSRTDETGLRRQRFAYALWLLGRQGVPLPEGVNPMNGDSERVRFRESGIMVPSPEGSRWRSRYDAVELLHGGTPWKEPRYYSGGHWRDDPSYSEPGIVVVPIPHWDFQPTVIENEEAMPAKVAA